MDWEYVEETLTLIDMIKVKSLSISSNKDPLSKKSWNMKQIIYKILHGLIENEYLKVEVEHE